MKRRVGLVKTCMIGALLSSAAWAVPGMQAQADDIPLKAPAATNPQRFGGSMATSRPVDVFLNDPQNGGNQTCATVINGVWHWR